MNADLPKEKRLYRDALDHSCLLSANEQLGKRNTALNIAETFSLTADSEGRRLVISTVKIDPRKRGLAITLFANFCPFCGEHLP